MYIGTVHVPDGVIREAVKERNLTGRSYVLCKRERVTGFDWLMIRNENGNKVYEYINIVGPTPWDLGLYHGFVQSNNTYVFYVEERRVVYSEAVLGGSFEYVVLDWDILYPVRREFFPIDMLFQTWRYITKDDLHSGWGE